MARRDCASRLISAEIGRVFDALVDRTALETWLPPDGMTGRFERFDPSRGGSYRLILTYSDPAAAHAKSSADSDVVEARYVDIVPNDRVVQAVDFESDDPAFAGTMTMTWAVSARRDGTLVEFTADDVPDGISVEDHSAGMTSSLENLASYLDASSPLVGSTHQPMGLWRSSTVTLVLDAIDVIMIHQLLGNYGHALDRRDWDTFTGLFVPDATIDYRGGTSHTQLAGREEVVRWFRDGGEQHPAAHHVTNIFVETTAARTGRVDVHSKFIAPFTRDAHTPKRLYGGDYHDIVVETAAGWKFAHKQCIPLWQLAVVVDESAPQHRRTY